MGCNNTKSVQSSDLQIALNYFDPVKVGDVEFKNRIVMGAMTRCRADPKDGIANDLMAEYYSQRASFGMILTECSQISDLSISFPGSAGIYNKEQTEGWKKVVKRVHDKGGKIYLQIWHSGRAVMSEFINGATPLAPSAIAIRKDHPHLNKPHPVPKEMTKEDIQEVIKQFKQGALNAKEAGFDGVQLHGANGYLIDQFLRDGTNKRTDEYGGSIENRCRFCLEVLDALIEVFGAGRVGIKLSPTGRYNDIYDSNPLELMKHLLKELEKKKIAFVEIKRHGYVDSGKTAEGAKEDEYGQTLPELQIPDFFKAMRPLYTGILIANDGLNQQTGLQLLRSKQADLVSFASLAISNPDLPERFKNNWEIAPSDYKTYFAGGEKGYTDYLPYTPKKEETKKEGESKEQHEEKKEDQHQEKKVEQHQEQKEEQHHEKQEEHHEKKEEQHQENQGEQHTEHQAENQAGEHHQNNAGGENANHQQ